MKVSEVMDRENLDKLLSQIERERDAWEEYVKDKREQYRERVIRWDSKQKMLIKSISIWLLMLSTQW